MGWLTSINISECETVLLAGLYSHKITGFPECLENGHISFYTSLDTNNTELVTHAIVNIRFRKKNNLICFLAHEGNFHGLNESCSPFKIYLTYIQTGRQARESSPSRALAVSPVSSSWDAMSNLLIYRLNFHISTRNCLQLLPPYLTCRLRKQRIFICVMTSLVTLWRR